MNELITRRFNNDLLYKTGNNQKKQWGSGISQRRENTGAYVIKKQERQSPDINVQIKRGIRHQLRRRIDQMQQPLAAEDSEQHQRRAEHACSDQGSVHCRFHLAVVLRPEKPGDDDGTADVAAKGECNEDQSNLVAVADRREGVLPDKFSCDKAVRNVVQLLKNNASEQWQTKLPQHLLGISHC